MSNRIVAVSGIALLLTAFAGCGGSGGTDAPGNSSTNRTTVGQITGLGSVYVNGIEFETAGANYEVDDVLASNDDALAVGMVVKVEGAVNADGLTGTAYGISYDDDVEGVVESLAPTDDPNTKTFAVMGVTVVADANKTNFDSDDSGFSFDTIADGDVVEVSGDYGPDGRLHGSYIEEQDADDNEYEAKGTVSDWDDVSTFVLNLRNGSILNVTLALGAVIPADGIDDGQFVEIEDDNGDGIADRVEIED